MADIGNVNFDHPRMFDWELLNATLRKLEKGEDVMIPNYNYKTCKREGPGVLVKAKPLVIFEGLFALLDDDI